MNKPILMMTFLALAFLAIGPGWCQSSEAAVSSGPSADNEITRLIGRITVGEPQEARNMVVFPLLVDGPTDPTEYATLDESIKNGWLEVCEKGHGRVQEVIVQNNSRRYVFLMAGEIISGARQNRVIATDTLLRPHGPEVAVPVYCVERGRWSGDTMAFTTEKSFANNELRYKAQSGAGQDAVWDEVARVSKEAGVSSETADFQAVVSNKEVKNVLDEYDKIMPRCPQRCIGAVIVINNGSSEGTADATQASHRIAGVEVFANETLFAALWPKIRRGYALDAYPLYKTWRPIQVSGNYEPLDQRDVLAFLHRVYRTRFTSEDPVDLGLLYAIRGNGIAGEGIVFESSVVHVNFAPERYVIQPVKPQDVRELDGASRSQEE